MSEDSGNIEIAKKAYIALNTVKTLIKAIPDNPPIRTGELIANQINTLLREVHNIFSIDNVFKESIAHLKNLQYKYEPGGSSEGAFWVESDNGSEVASQAKMLLAELEAKLVSFVSFYMPAEEKRQIGFNS